MTATLNAPASTGADKDLTGRSIVTFARGASIQNINKASQRWTAQFAKPEVAVERIFHEFGLGIVNVSPEELQDAADGIIEHIAPERRVKAPRLHTVAAPKVSINVDLIAAEAALNNNLDSIGVLDSPFTGKGVTIAMLDSGLDFRHPDFASRLLTVQSKVIELGAQDVMGHGTFTAGLACGPLRSNMGRYGVAPDATLIVIRVLDDDGFGSDEDVLSGIKTAADLGADIIVMPFAGGPDAAPHYESIAKLFLGEGILMLASAGNDTSVTMVGPTGYPANCASIMAVSAVDKNLNPSVFSNGSNKVDIAAPGENVLSAWAMPDRYARQDGTTAAAAIAGGIAALWAQATGKRGDDLRKVLQEQVTKKVKGVVGHEVGIVAAP